MQRKRPGHYESTTVAGDRVQAFVPAPLPPHPPIQVDSTLLEAAQFGLGRLDGAAAALPDRALFLYSYVRKEAVFSSRIEGTQSSLSDLLLYEMEGAPGVPVDDVVEVSNYVAALEHGVARLAEGFPISSRLIRELHAILLRGGRGSSKDPGEFRQSQNWIGGTRPATARHVPPPHHRVPDCIAELERFIHTKDDGLPMLVRAGLAHAQFETIHPFLDGNGRVGRLLITLLLHDAQLLREPLLYLSLYFKQHRQLYYDMLDVTRRDGDWEAWLAFFLEGVATTANHAATTAQHIAALFREDAARVRAGGRRAKSGARVHEVLMARPIVSVTEAAQQTDLSFSATARAIELLVELGIAVELTGKRRGRMFAYRAYMDLLSEGDDD